MLDPQRKRGNGLHEWFKDKRVYYVPADDYGNWIPRYWTTHKELPSICGGSDNWKEPRC